MPIEGGKEGGRKRRGRKGKLNIGRNGMAEKHAQTLTRKGQPKKRDTNMELTQD